MFRAGYSSMLGHFLIGIQIFLTAFFSSVLAAYSVDRSIQSAFDIAGLETVVNEPKQMPLCSNSEGISITKYRSSGKERVSVTNGSSQEFYYYESDIYITNRPDRWYGYEKIKILGRMKRF